jgi:hypothetical protein
MQVKETQILFRRMICNMGMLMMVIPMTMVLLMMITAHIIQNIVPYTAKVMVECTLFMRGIMNLDGTACKAWIHTGAVHTPP